MEVGREEEGGGAERRGRRGRREEAFQIDLCVMESKAFVKSIVAILILIPRSWHFCSIILYVARWSVVWYELLNPA